MNDRVLLDIARKSIESKLAGEELVDKELLLNEYPELGNSGATFVTLTIDNQLRGCIGSLVAHRSLLDDLISNAKSAAFSDPRFYELTKEEFTQTDVEVSILSEPVAVEFSSFEDLKNKISPNIHGVILKQGGRQSTFLPQVWEQLPDFESFIAHLCQKGGIDCDRDNFNVDVYTYTVKKIKEDGIL